MDGKKVVKLLQQAGWRHVGTHGSHYKMKKPGYKSIIVPVHGSKDLKIGTLKNIERSTNIRLIRR